MLHRPALLIAALAGALQWQQLEAFSSSSRVVQRTTTQSGILNQIQGFQQNRREATWTAPLSVASASPPNGGFLDAWNATTNDRNGLVVNGIKQVQQKVQIKEDDEATRKKDFVRFSRLLSFNSGFLNGIFLTGILGRVQAVGPVTDSWTKFGLAVATGDVAKAGFVARILFSFGFGAMICGGFLQRPTNKTYDLSQRKRALVPAGLLLGMASFLVNRATANQAPVLAFMMVCMANGIQNSFSSTLSSNLCRTTHMTGTFTDLSTYVGQALFQRNYANTHKLRTYSSLILSFCVGGILGGSIVKQYTDVAMALMLSSIFYVACATMPKPSFLQSNHHNGFFP